MKKNPKQYWKLGRAEYSTQFFDINKEGELLVKEGNYQYNVFELAKKYGTSLEIVFPFIIEHRVEELINTFKHYIKQYRYKGRFYFHYPMKVNQNREFILPLITEDANLETASANELWIVKRLWEQHRFNSRIKVICNGPKTVYYISLIKELRDRGLDIVPIIESRAELEQLVHYKGQVGVRVNLDIKTSSHWDKRSEQFGFSPEDLYEIGKINNLSILHYHVGSQIEYANDIIFALKEGIKIYQKLKESNPRLDTINIGGGFAVNYEKQKTYSVQSVVQRIISTLAKYAEINGNQSPHIICEWGRHIMAPAQITVYRVLLQKDIKGGRSARKWYVVDGSFMNDLLDTWAIHQKWHVVPVNNMLAKKMQRVWLAGLSCDSDDKYTGGSYVFLPSIDHLEEGESLYIALFDTGAYQDALASHHCLLASPAKIICQDGDIEIARKRESAEEVGKSFGW
jgi:arginine decarboxylase